MLSPAVDDGHGLAFALGEDWLQRQVFFEDSLGLAVQLANAGARP